MLLAGPGGGVGGGGRIGQVVLGKLPAPGRHTIRTLVDQGPTALAVGAGGVVWIIFTLLHLFLPLSGRRSDKDWNTVSKGGVGVGWCEGAG